MAAEIVTSQERADLAAFAAKLRENGKRREAGRIERLLADGSRRGHRRLAAMVSAINHKAGARGRLGDGTLIDWLVKNLPSILELLMKVLKLFI
jgi:hypothetical protein